MEQLDTFLARHPPFDALDGAVLRQLAADGRELEFEAGQDVLVEDALPATGLWVLLTGSMAIVHEGEAIQILEPGECFGHPSLLTGMAPAFTVRAREPSRCLLLEGAVGRRVLGTEAGAAYVAATMRTRLTSSGQTVHGLLDMGTTPVAAIMRPPAFCEADAPLSGVARRLGEPEVTALLTRLDGGRLGIVTDAQIRAIVADGGDLDAPVRTIARVPVPTVPASQLAIEATVDMLAAETEHVAVLDGDCVCGMVSAEDLLELDARGPIALRHAILGAADETSLGRSVAGLPELFLLLMRAGVRPRDLGRTLSLQHDAVVARLIDFSLRRHGPAPVPWTWLDLGSVARRELTLASDQDNGLVYASPRPGEEEGVDAYFARLGAYVNRALASFGVGTDNNGVLAGSRLWRMSKPRWVATFEECLRAPNESRLIRATVAFDFRPTAGGLAVASELTHRVRAARDWPDFMRLMARIATGYPVALGFRSQLATGREGDPAGRLDLKRGAITPLVNLVRFHALVNGVTISPTLDRIEAVAGAGGLDGGTAEALAAAFTVITRVRFEHHAEQIAGGAAPDNLIDPGALTPIARSDLREALVTVRNAQRRVPA